MKDLEQLLEESQTRLRDEYGLPPPRWTLRQAMDDYLSWMATEGTFWFLILLPIVALVLFCVAVYLP